MLLASLTIRLTNDNPGYLSAMAAPRKSRDAHWSAPTHAPGEVDVGRLHSALVHVLRLLRDADRASGVSPSRLSVLSVLVFVRPMSQAELARIEGVSAPSMSLLVRELETDGLVARAADPADGRRTIVSATAAGRALMVASQQRRLAWLRAALDRVPAASRDALAESSAHLEALTAALREVAPE